MLTPEEFVPLHAWLRGPVVEPTVEIATVAACEDVPAIERDVALALRDARLFRARLADALDDAVARLLPDVMLRVLGRELTIAPADVAAIVARTRDAAPARLLLHVRVAPIDAAMVLGAVPVLADATLAAGDALLVFADGSVDATLGVRMRDALAELS